MSRRQLHARARVPLTIFSISQPSLAAVAHLQAARGHEPGPSLSARKLTQLICPPACDRADNVEVGHRRLGERHDPDFCTYS